MTLKITGVTAKGSLVLRLAEKGLSAKDAFQIASELQPMFQAYEDQQMAPLFQAEAQPEHRERQAALDAFDALACGLKLQRGETGEDGFRDMLPPGNPYSWAFLVKFTSDLIHQASATWEIGADEQLEVLRQDYSR